MNEQDFATMLARAREGDREAMTYLVQGYEAQIRRVARHCLGPALRAALDSMDLVQSVHKSLLLGLRQNKFTLDSPDNLVAVAVTILKRKAARKAIRLKREQEILRIRDLLLPRADPQWSAAQAAELQEILEALTDFDRQLLELYREGRSTVEVAGLLDKNPNSLRVYRSRLFSKLRAIGLSLDQ
jgi:RNA polymerase sigma-70 factor (ECF subfamily)